MTVRACITTGIASPRWTRQRAAETLGPLCSYSSSGPRPGHPQVSGIANRADTRRKNPRNERGPLENHQESGVVEPPYLFRNLGEFPGALFDCLMAPLRVLQQFII